MNPKMLQLPFSRLVLLLEILAICQIYFHSFSLAFQTAVPFSLLLANFQSRSLKFVMRLKDRSRTISQRCSWNLLPYITYYNKKHSDRHHFLFSRKAALTGLPIQVIRGSETPVVCVKAIMIIIIPV